MSRISKSKETIAGTVAGEKDRGVTANGYRVSSEGDEVVITLVVMVAHLCEYSKNPLNCRL